jgi:hypothetical protein
MRGTILSAIIFTGALVACGGNHNGASVCDNVVPAPAACMQACDAQPGAPNTCPGGYHCTPDGHCDAVCTPSGNECGDGFMCSADGQCEENGACEGIACNVVKCESMGMPATTISGTVFAPNGTLPLFGVQVYVPLHDVGALPDGAICGKCADTPLGDPIASDITKEDGTFSIPDVPSGTDVPLVIVSGKWRRIVKVSTVTQCTTTMVGATDTTFPKSMTDMTPNTISVNMPKIAITTGGADNLECLLRKMGVADKEITIGGGAGHVQLYSGTGGVSKLDPGAQNIPSATTFWSSADNLKPYDAVILSCEGAQNPGTKPQPALDAMKAYADIGGRVFASHWHNIWIEGSTQGGGNQKPAVWPMIATWSNGGDLNNTAVDAIDEANNPKGSSFATWMLNVGGSTTRDDIALVDGTGKTTCAQVDITKAERWTTVKSAPNASDGNGVIGTTQNFQFVTPAEGDPANACGKVVFSDMHVSGASGGGNYPGSCGATLTLTPQEKALAFMLFDLSSCVGTLF